MAKPAHSRGACLVHTAQSESHLALLANERDRYAIVDIRDGRVLAEPVDGWSIIQCWRMIALPNEDGISVIGSTIPTRS